jgi:ribosome-associated heat shock protein Hsp15
MRGHRDDPDDAVEDRDGSDVRLDKWLWAARFYKTRSLAAEAIVGGKVHLNGERVKRAKTVAVGDEVRVRNGAFEHIVHVRALSARRGGAADASRLYEETAASRAAREALAAQLRSLPETHGRPTKRDRREIERWRRR